jgi:ribulose 1,5-bisphosphate synthetase/thiazole synthase
MNRMESTSAAHLVKMTQSEEFDLVILGGGTGSTVAAWTFAGEGNRVAVVDRKCAFARVPQALSFINLI